MFASGHRCYILFYAVVSGMGLFFLGLLLQLIALQWKFFHKMFFLIFTQKSTLLEADLTCVNSFEETALL
jgi:hypothetical protein